MAATEGRGSAKTRLQGAIERAPLVRETLQEQLYGRLRAALVGGAFQPGEGVTIRALADQFETSTTPVREALRRLVSESSLEMQPNRTVRVPPLTAARLVELCRIRGALESLATELAAARVTNRQILRLEQLCQDMAEAIEAREPGKYLGAHRAFHFQIYDAAESPLLLSIIENTWVQLGPYLHLMFDGRGALQTPEVHHGEIVAALRARDAPGAAQAVARDTQAAAEFLAVPGRLPE